MTRVLVFLVGWGLQGVSSGHSLCACCAEFLLREHAWGSPNAVIGASMLALQRGQMNNPPAAINLFSTITMRVLLTLSKRVCQGNVFRIQEKWNSAKMRVKSRWKTQANSSRSSFVLLNSRTGSYKRRTTDQKNNIVIEHAVAKPFYTASSSERAKLSDK